ncbi:uncharacterized protein LOC119592127 [Penaeus monodon]|uniref:uncharacterized protein LOC119592127 n=1 Tax=Penaeus monodon TaxID=6687 RepID=UPI0018A7C40F|nr:uncharacterized protein LOC119592127 [Penaeus monodon]
MYVWARNTILGDLNGLCFGGREFGAGRTGGKFKKLPVSQERIDKWGESLRVSGNITLPTYETTTAASNPIICDGETKLGLLLQCQDLFADVTYDGTPVSDDLYQVSVDFCTFDLCAMTLSQATQEAIDNWKIIMIGMLANTIEIIVHTLPIEAPTTVAPGYCTFDGKIYANGEEFENSCLILVCERDTWRPTGRINSACTVCSIRNDPHFIDFFAWAFDFHGINNYAIAKNADSSGVTGDFYECYPFISCLDIITYKDDAATVVTFDRNGGNTILVNGSPFVVTNAVQNVESAGGVAHPVLAWKHNANCIRIVGTRGIAVAFCGWEMYVWAQNAILGGLEGLCLAGPAFELANPPSDFSILRVPQEEIDAWGESLRVSGSHAARNVRSSDIKSNCDEATEEELLQVCLALLRGASYNGYPASHALLQVIAQFCKVDLCAMTLANATQEAIDNWKAVMVDMLENSIEVIVSSLPPGHPQDPEEEHGGRDSIDIKVQVLQEVNL